MEYNANLGKVSIKEENVIDPSHPPIIETHSIETITTNFNGVLDIEGESNLIPAGCVVAIDKTTGNIKHYKDIATNEKVVVIVNDTDTKKDSVTNILLHGTVKENKLYRVTATGVEMGLDDEIKKKLQASNIYVV